MPNDNRIPESRSKNASTARKLIQAAALAAVLVPLGSVVVETSSMTFKGASAGNVPTNTYSFGDIAFTLQFVGLLPTSFFDVDVTPSPTNDTQLGFDGRPLPTGYDCIPLTVGNCWEFFVTPGALDSGDGWTSWIGTIQWLLDTNADFPGAHVEFFHSHGGPYGFATVPGSYNGGTPSGPTGGDPCDYGAFCGGDPSISGTDPDFSPVIAGGIPASAVPEPATLLLVAGGISSLLYRRRGQRREP